MRTLILLFFSICLSAQQPNIIFVMLDDAGYAEFGYTSNGTFSTPHFDTLVSGGMFFNYAYASPVCTPSRAMLMTGRYAYRSKMHTSYLSNWDNEGLPIDRPILPQYLKALGYTTGIVGKWHLGMAHPEQLPNARGFDYSFCHFGGGVEYDTYEGYGMYDLHENGERFDTTGYLTNIFGAKAVQFIQRCADAQATPFFLYFTPNAPHVPLDATPTSYINQAPAYLTATEKKLWANMKIADEQIGLIRQVISGNGMDSSTVIIVTNDNGGPTYWESNNGQLQGAKYNMAEGGVRVPFVWNQPGVVAGGTTCDTAICLTDLLPTFVSLAGGSVSKADSVDGVDITLLTTGGTIDSRYFIPNLLPGNTWAIYKGRWKLVRNKLAWAEYLTPRPDTIQLFDVLTDPYETTDVSASHAALVSELQAIIDAQSIIASDTVYMANPREAPSGWVDFPAWGQTKMFYDTNYYWFRAFR